MQLSFTAATKNDTCFIQTLLLSGIRKGHFDKRLHERREQLRNEIGSIIEKRKLYQSPLSAQAWIFRHGDVRVGFSILSAISHGITGYELYAIAVHSKFRGKGYGGIILDEMLHYYAGPAIYARCFPASEILYQMLLRRHFEHLYTTPNHARVLRCTIKPVIAARA